MAASWGQKALCLLVVTVVSPDKERHPSFVPVRDKNVSWNEVKSSLPKGHFILNSSGDSKNYNEKIVGLPASESSWIWVYLNLSNPRSNPNEAMRVIRKPKGLNFSN